MPTWNTGELTTNNVRLHYQRANNGKRPLLLAHGLTDDGPCWLPVAGQLAGAYDVIMYDARGHGRSDKPAEGYTFDALAADMAGLIEALGLDKPIVLGHSMGAATAALAAARFPDLIGALLLEDPAVRNEIAPEQVAGVLATWRANLLADQALGREALIAKQRALAPKWSQAELEVWADSKERVSPDALEIIRTPGTHWNDLVGQIECPILLITADPALGVAVSPEQAAEIQAQWRAGRLVQIANAGHSIRRDQPAAFMAAVGEFLAGL